MKLKINDFGSSLNIAKFNFLISELDDLKIEAPLEVNGELIKGTDQLLGDMYTIVGSYSGTIKLECVRCLKEISANVSGEFQWKFLEPKNYSTYIKSFKQESEIDSDGYEEAQNGEIDVAEIVRQQILLDLDFYPTCQPFCDDDSEIEKYSNNGMDQRWAKLLEIKE